MLTITLPETEFFDPEKNEFIILNGGDVTLEHSLSSLAKWESKWHTPFLKPKRIFTPEQTLFYVECMLLSSTPQPMICTLLYQTKLDLIYNYIGEPMTATTISSLAKNSGSQEIITAEIIYYWMTSFNIPFECQYWHLNRLLTLIAVCSLKAAPKKKIPASELRSRNSALNAARKKSLNTRG